MSAPYGQQPPAPPGTSRPSRGSLDLGRVLALVPAGLGLIVYLGCFASAASAVRGSLSLVLFLGAGLLSAATLLPNVSRMLVPAAVLSALGSLTLLISVVSSPVSVPPFEQEASRPGIVIAILILGILQTGVLVSTVLLEAGIIAPTAGGGPSRQPSRAAQSPAPPGQYPPGQYGPPPGHYQYPPAGYPQYGRSPQEPPSGSGQQGHPATAQYGQSGRQQQGQPGPLQQGQYGQPGPPYQAHYGRPGPPQQGQQGPPPGAYGQYEQQAPAGGQPDRGDGTTPFIPLDRDQQDEPGELDPRRRHGPPEGSGSAGPN